MRIHLLTIGRAKGEFADLAAEYSKRLSWPLTLREFEPKPATREKESAVLLEAVPAGSRVIACDERGKQLTSVAFADKLRSWQDDGARDVAFIIGGAGGHTDALRQRADLLLGMGQMTWPHMLARVMLIEQIYRAQQIIAGHPYHRA